MKLTHVKIYFQKRCIILAFLSISALFVSELGRFFWVFELFSHFTPYYMIALIAGAFASNILWQKRLFTLIASLLLIWMNIPLIRPIIAPPSFYPNPLKFITYNLNINNAHLKNSIQWLIETDADVIFLTEATLLFQNDLNMLRNQYPYECEQLNNSPFGLALYSKVPLQHCEILTLNYLEMFPYIRATLSDKRIIYGIHPPPPITPMLAFKRDLSFDELAYKISSEYNDVLVMGDMNTSPFSIKYRTFIKESKLKNINVLWQPTWTPGLLSLDHILIKSSYDVKAKGIGPWMGSDHRPVWAIW